VESPPLQWENLDGWYLPRSADDGPDDGWRCYAHTPTGALLAAYTIPLRLVTADDYETVAREQTVPGVGQQTFLAEGPGPVTIDSPPVPAGFRVDQYDPNRATVTVYLRYPDLEMSCSTRVEWVDGDWRLALEPNGDTYPGCVEGPPPGAWAAWGPTV
jgi:hypothetical protein